MKSKEIDAKSICSYWILVAGHAAYPVICNLFNMSYCAARKESCLLHIAAEVVEYIGVVFIVYTINSGNNNELRAMSNEQRITATAWKKTSGTTGLWVVGCWKHNLRKCLRWGSHAIDSEKMWFVLWIVGLEKIDHLHIMWESSLHNWQEAASDRLVTDKEVRKTVK